MLTRRRFLDSAIGAGLAWTMSRAAAAQSDQLERNKAVVRRFKDATFVRSKLTREDEELSEAEVKQGRQKIEPLSAGDRVVSRGVVELMACLEDQLTKERVSTPRKEK